MPRPIRYYLLIFWVFTQIPASYSQDLHQSGKEFLQSRSINPGEYKSNFIFTKETIEGSQTILESDNPGCFIIYQRIGQENRVVAYSTDNSFTQKDTLLPGAKSLIQAISKAPSKLLLKNAHEGELLPVGPMLKTAWNQDDWYNRYCPFNVKCKAGENAYAGCVAVAMGQILRYYGKWNSFTIDANHTYEGQTLSAYSTGYPWSKMINTPINYDLDVSKMLSDIGILIKMNYGYQASSQGTGWARIGFNDLGFENAYKTEYHHFSTDDWLEMIYTSLDNYSPVFVAGGGHAFVCDGYDEDGRLHFNLGWGGVADGYYDHTCVRDKYCVNEAIFDLNPENDFESPHAIRIEYPDGSPLVTWSPPYQDNNVVGYNIYYSDDDFFTIQDTSILLENLRPGSLSIKVSALYPEGGESLWIGPVWAFNQGEDVMITDPALSEAVRKSIETQHMLLLGSNPTTAGKIADIQNLQISETLHSTIQIGRMAKLQEITINGTGLLRNDLAFLDSLKHLQTLKISHLDCAELPPLKSLSKLVQLSLDSCTISNMDFLSGLDHLVVLELNACEIEDFQLPSDLTGLEQLVLSDLVLSGDIIFSMSDNFRGLTISGCGLMEFNPPDFLPRLTNLKLDNNNLNNTFFLSKLPNLKNACINNNKISRLDIHSEHEYLSNLDLSNNIIDKVAISFDIPSLLSLNMSHNEFTHFPGIFKNMPNLETLIISYNSINGLPDMRLPYLRVIDLSFNQLNHICDIELFEALNHLNIKGNKVSDLSPLVKNDNYRNLLTLDVSENPVSKESYFEILPELVNEVGIVYAPKSYEPRSPCYPVPGSPSKVSNREVNFSWFCESENPETRYDFHFGVGDSIRTINLDLSDHRNIVRLYDDQIYNWQIEAHFGDTSFFSGLYEIRTTKELEIPYLEDFEVYSPGEGIANSSSNWRLTHGSSDSYQDADISNTLQATGFGNSLHVYTTSNLTIDLDHIDVTTLIIEFDQYIIPGKTGHLCFKNMHGLQIDIYSSGHRSEVYANGSPMQEFTVISGQWNNFRVSIQGHNERIIMKCNNKTILNKKWEFKNSRAQIEGIIFSSDNLSVDGAYSNFETYFDNIHVYDADNRTSVELTENINADIRIFPNPANQDIMITGIPVDQNKISIDIINSYGQVVLHQQLLANAPEITLPVNHLSSGVYYYRLMNKFATLHSGKILIAR